MRYARAAACIIMVMVLFALAGPASAQSINIDLGQGGTLTGRVIQLILLMTVLSLAPSILIMMTSFTRIVIVFSILRSALGTQQSPPNIVMISLALFLTGYIMFPTLQAAYQEGIEPLVAEEIDEGEAFNRSTQPMKMFMLANVREKDLRLFFDYAPGAEPDTAVDTPLASLIPAFMISELKRAFEIGFMIYVPFIIIDMAVASVLMSMGMMMVPPVLISLPFKLIFFVLTDGWNMLAGSLIESFRGAPPI